MFLKLNIDIGLNFLIFKSFAAKLATSTFVAGLSSDTFNMREFVLSNFKSIEWYNNTNLSYAYDSSSKKVKATYGTATAKPHADTTYTNTDKSNGEIPDGKDVGDVKEEGLKTIKKRQINDECAAILAPSDWMYIKAGEEGVSMDSGWKTWRASVRTKCNSMQTQIDNAADTAALETLFTYTTTDGVTSRPLGEFPVKE